MTGGPGRGVSTVNEGGALFDASEGEGVGSSIGTSVGAGPWGISEVLGVAAVWGVGGALGTGRARGAPGTAPVLTGNGVNTTASVASEATTASMWAVSSSPFRKKSTNAGPRSAVLFRIKCGSSPHPDR